MHAGHRPGQAGTAARWRRQGAAQTARNQLDGSSVRSAQPPPPPPASPLEADVPPSNHFASGKSERTDFGWGAAGVAGVVVVIVVAAVVRHWQHLWRYVKNCRMQGKKREGKTKEKPNNAQQTERHWQKKVLIHWVYI